MLIRYFQFFLHQPHSLGIISSGGYRSYVSQSRQKGWREVLHYAPSMQACLFLWDLYSETLRFQSVSVSFSEFWVFLPSVTLPGWGSVAVILSGAGTYMSQSSLYRHWTWFRDKGHIFSVLKGTPKYLLLYVSRFQLPLGKGLLWVSLGSHLPHPHGYFGYLKQSQTVWDPYLWQISEASLLYQLVLSGPIGKKDVFLSPIWEWAVPPGDSCLCPWI